MNKNQQSRQCIVDCIEQDLLAKESISDALFLTEVYPKKQAWSHFLQQSLLWLGALALSFSLLFFVAANWKALGHFSKFTLAEAFILLCIVIHIYKAKTALSKQVTLVCANIGVGVLLALFGQTYQTGADPWQLFATWAALVLPWTLLSCSAVMWLLWIILINVALIIYEKTFGPLLFLDILGLGSGLWTLAIVNSVFLLVWEICSTKYQWLAKVWATRCIAICSGAAITSLTVIEFSFENNFIVFIIWLLWMMTMIHVYRKLRPDLFVLAGAFLSILSVVITALGMLSSSFILLTIFTISIGSLSAIWLKKESKKMQERKEL